MNVHFNIIHNSQKEITYIYISGQMNKQYLDYLYSRILFSHKKEGSTIHAKI